MTLRLEYVNTRSRLASHTPVIDIFDQVPNFFLAFANGLLVPLTIRDVSRDTLNADDIPIFTDNWCCRDIECDTLTEPVYDLDLISGQGFAF